MQLNEGFCALPSIITDFERQLMIDYLNVAKQRYCLTSAPMGPISVI